MSQVLLNTYVVLSLLSQAALLIYVKMLDARIQRLESKGGEA